MSLAQLLGSIENTAWLLTFVCEVALLARMWQLGLWKVYRWFAVFLALNAGRSSLLYFVDRTSNWYGYIFFAFLPLLLIAALMLVLELNQLVLRAYAGIGTLGRWVVTGGLVVSFFIAVASSPPDLAKVASDTYPLLHFLNVLERVANSALLLFLVIITGFLVWFPISLSRNTVLYLLGFAVWFFSGALLHLVSNIRGSNDELTMILGAVDMAVAVACMVVWLLFLRREEESRTVTVGHQWRPEERDRLIGQLNTINASLVRSARK